MKPVIENIRKALASTNVGVRTAGVSLLGVLFLYMGDSLRPLVEGEKPSLLQQINAEFEKVNIYSCDVIQLLVFLSLSIRVSNTRYNN